MILSFGAPKQCNFQKVYILKTLIGNGTFALSVF